ncbi:MAG: hypothetical protein P4L30_11480 [Candidatus Limnocylindrales bacterium]|nr:hypothetical protein [Candidatus Limnocylindrales bacterium]
MWVHPRTIPLIPSPRGGPAQRPYRDLDRPIVVLLGEADAIKHGIAGPMLVGIVAFGAMPLL